MDGKNSKKNGMCRVRAQLKVTVSYQSLVTRKCLLPSHCKLALPRYGALLRILYFVRKKLSLENINSFFAFVTMNSSTTIT